MTDRDIKFMGMAFDIAFSRIGKTSPNPSVGAVIVKDDRVISTGGTLSCGADHAEISAIKNAKSDLKGAEIYISLEPCSHYNKKTPPCVDAIIDSGISRVNIPIIDPNPAVSGDGIKKLKNAGIDVVVLDELANKAYDLIRQFEKYVIKKKPFILHKSAITLDGRIAAKNGDSKWISNEYSRYIVHKLRNIVDAVIIGKNTLQNDDPSLNIRLDSFPEGVGRFFAESRFSISGRDNFFLHSLLKYNETVENRSPLRVVIGLPDIDKADWNIFNDENYLFFAHKERMESIKNSGQWKSLSETGKIVFTENKSGREQIIEIMNELYNRGKMFNLLEGGGSIAGSFFDAGEVDQFLYFITPKVIGSGISPVNGDGKELMKDALTLHDVSNVALKGDILYNGYAKAPEQDYL